MAQSGKGQVLDAPVNMGMIRNAGQTLSFGSGSMPGCLKMRGSIRIGELGIYTESTSPSVLTSIVLNVGTSATSITGTTATTLFAVAPQNSKYFPSPVSLLSQIFNRFRMKTRLEFRSRSATSNNGAIKMCYIDDMTSFYAMTGKTGYGLSVAQLVANRDLDGYAIVTECPVWAPSCYTPWSTFKPGEDMRYVGAPTYTNFLDPLADEDSILRQSTQGAWLFALNSVSSVAAGSFSGYGEVWCHYELELCDIMTRPVSSGLQSSGDYMRRVVPSLEDRISKVLRRMGTTPERRSRSKSPDLSSLRTENKSDY